MLPGGPLSTCQIRPWFGAGMTELQASGRQTIHVRNTVLCRLSKGQNKRCDLVRCPMSSTPTLQNTHYCYKLQGRGDCPEPAVAES